MTTVPESPAAERLRPVFTIGDRVVIDGSNRVIVVDTNVFDPRIAFDRVCEHFGPDTRKKFLGKSHKNWWARMEKRRTRPSYPNALKWKYKLWLPLGDTGAAARNHGEGVLGKFIYIDPNSRDKSGGWKMLVEFGTNFNVETAPGEFIHDGSVFEGCTPQEYFTPLFPFPVSWDWEETIRTEWPMILDRAKRFSESTWKYHLGGCFPAPEINKDGFSPDFTLEAFVPKRVR